MDRISWLRERRKEAEERYSTWWAPLYWDKYGLYPNESHLQFLKEFLELVPPNSTVLDAACGAGRYLSELIARGHTVIGIDQSQGMLDRARERFPEVQFENIGLQEMSYQQVFEGAICMDAALENICPEDLTPVLHNFYVALKQNGCLYFTVEIADETEVKAAFEEAQKLGLPVVHGEWVNDEVYHYYPSLEQVREWVRGAGLTILGEGEGDGYHHFLMRKQ
jgi:SAM-dependent methyltransferase